MVHRIISRLQITLTAKKCVDIPLESVWIYNWCEIRIPCFCKFVYASIEVRRNRPLQGGKYLNVYVDGIYLKRNRGGEYKMQYPSGF